MAPLPGLNKGVFKDPDPPLVDSLLSPQTIPNGTTLVTTKPHNEIIDNIDELIDYVSGDNGPNFIPQLAIDTLVSDLTARELLANKVTTIGTPGNDTNYGTEKAIRDALNLKEDSLGFTPEDSANKGAISGYAGLNASQELLLANFPSGSSLQVLRRNAANTALEFAASGGQVDSVVGTLNRISVDSGDPVNPIVDIDSGYVGQTSITTLGTITTGVWNGTAITGSNINAALADLSDVTAKTGTGTTVVMDTSPTIITPTIASFLNANHDHETAVGGGTLIAAAISDFDTAVSANSDVTANTAKITNATHTGDVTGATALTITNDAVTYAKIQNVVADNVLLGNVAGAGSIVAELTGAQVNLILPVFTDTLNGLVPLSGGGTTNFLRADGTWAVPAGAGGEVFTWTNDHSMDTFKLIAAAGNDVILNAPTGQGVSFEIAGVQEYLFDATEADFGNKPIVDLNHIVFNASGFTLPSPSISYIASTPSGFQMNVPTGDNIVFTANGSTSMTLSSTILNMLNHKITLGTGSLQFNLSTRTIRVVGTELQYDVATGDTHTFRENNIPVFEISGTEADLLGNDLRNFGFIESDASDVPSTGTIRLGSLEGLSYAGFGGDNPQFFYNDTTGHFTFTSDNSVNLEPTITLQQTNTTPSNSHFVGNVFFNSFNSLAAVQTFAHIIAKSFNVTTGAEEGELRLGVVSGGVGFTNFIILNDAANNQIDFFRDLQTNNNDILLGTGQLTVTSGVLGDLFKHDATGFSRFALGTNPGQFLRVDAAGTDLEYADDIFTINYIIDGGGSTITTGIKGTITVDFDCEVLEWAVTADQSGDIVVDVNRSTFAGYPTTSSIAGTELPTIIASTKGEDRTITTWSTITAGDVLQFEVDSITTLQRVTVSLVCRKIG